MEPFAALAPGAHAGVKGIRDPCVARFTPAHTSSAWCKRCTSCCRPLERTRARPRLRGAPKCGGHRTCEGACGAAAPVDWRPRFPGLRTNGFLSSRTSSLSARIKNRLRHVAVELLPSREPVAVGVAGVGLPLSAHRALPSVLGFLHTTLCSSTCSGA